MSRIAVLAILVIGSLWAVRSYRMAERNENLADTLEETPAYQSDTQPVTADSPSRSVQASESASGTRSMASSPSSEAGIQPGLVEDLGEFYPGHHFSEEDLAEMRAEADRAEREGMIRSEERPFYMRSLAQHQVDRREQETDMIPDDMYSISDPDMFPEEVEE